MRKQPKDYLIEARKYTKRNLSKTKEYAQFKNNDYYHITKFTQYMWRKLEKNNPKIYKKIFNNFKRATRHIKL